jgi:hypothetical protein
MMKKIVAAAVAALFALGSLSVVAAEDTSAAPSSDQSTMTKAKKKTKRGAHKAKKKTKHAAHKAEDKMGMNKDNAGGGTAK